MPGELTRLLWQKWKTEESGKQDPSSKAKIFFFFPTYKYSENVNLNLQPYARNAMRKAKM